MDDRRRTISSEEQMIGEALMRVSNTLEAQRLTKSLDYQEKLRSRSNVRLIIAIICLFTAMMMMIISGALLFVLWRYADPVLDVVMPFLKNVMADFGVIWDGLVESLSYVPVMVEQLTRLLEQVIIMLEGINSIDLGGLMGYLSKMLGGLMSMMDDLKAALAPMMDALGKIIQSLANDIISGNGLNGVLTDLFGPDAAQNLKDFAQGMMNMLGGTGKTLGALGNTMNAAGDAIDANVKNGNIQNLVDALDGALKSVGDGISGNVSSSDMAALVQGGGKALNGTGAALGRLGTDMNAFAEEGVMGLLRKLLSGN